ncbi:hypothetical protein FXW78_50395 [Rhodococcus opacus]|nr:hypothetical protein [Rhodococcus opacus]
MSMSMSDAVPWPQSADEEKVSAEPVADSDAAPTAAAAKPATTDADAADNPQPDAADERRAGACRCTAIPPTGYGGGPVPPTGPPGTDTVIKPKPLRPAVDGGFTLDDFTVDEAGGTVTCPAGPQQADEPKADGDLSAGYAPAARSDPGCHHSARRPFDDHPPARGFAAGRPRQARTPQFKQDYPTRSTVERIIAWAATQNGHRLKLRYLGVRKNDAWLRTRCASMNLRTLVNSGLTRRTGCGALA